MAQGSDADISASERAFLDQIRAFHASGGDLDEVVRAELLREAGEKRVRIVIGQEDDDDMHLEIRSAPRLWHAARAGWCMTMNWLIAHGADVNCCDLRFGFAPLTLAAATNQHDQAVILLDAGARVDSSSRVQRTALHFAAINDNIGMVKLLLSRGAPLDVRDKYGKDPETDARGHWELVDFLAAVREAGGWRPYVDAPRQELLALRRELPSLRERGLATSSSSVPLHERLFVKAPEDVFQHTIAYWRAPRDL